jgi:hypothetical protein
MRVFLLGLPQAGKTTVATTLAGKVDVVDGLFSPRDFVNWFDPAVDTVIFLNRTNLAEQADTHHALGISVMRDYCLWLGTMGILDRDRWLEFNFALPGNIQDPFVKVLQHKNTVIIARSLNKVIELIKERLIK